MVLQTFSHSAFSCIFPGSVGGGAIGPGNGASDTVRNNYQTSWTNLIRNLIVLKFIS